LKWYRFGSRTKLILLLVIPSTLFVSIVIQIAKDYALDFLRETQNEALAGMSGQVVHLIRIYHNEITYNMLEMEQIIKQEGGTGDILYEAMQTVTRVRADFVRGVVFIGKDREITGYPSSFWGNFSDKEELLIEQQALRSRGVFEWSNTIRSDIGRTGNLGPTSLVTKTVLNDNGEPIGYLAFLVDLSAFLERSATFAGSYDTQTLLYDRDNRLIDYLVTSNANPLPFMFAEEEMQKLPVALEYFRDEGIYHSISTMETNLGWKVVVVGDVEKLESRFEPLSQIAWAILLFGLAGFLTIYIAVSWWFTRPILTLTKGIRKVAKGDLDTKVAVRQQDEFGELAFQFNQMTNTMKQLLIGLQQTEEAKRQADLQVLLSQINPHFLYNTLNTIDMMVDFNSKQELHKMIAVLCRLLKYNLDSHNERRSLEDELNYTTDFLYIQSVRYENKFDFQVQTPPETIAGYKVLKLLLQPIVENAVFHGLHPLEGRKGMLSVSVNQVDEDLLLSVTDNGVGISEDQTALLMSQFKGQENPESSSGIGILNVNRRIQLYYGSEYGLSVVSERGAGTTVIIKVPIGHIKANSRKEGGKGDG
jgi:two-component system sensor histidine kinase YesM